MCNFSSGILVFVLIGYVCASITYQDVLNREFELFKVKHQKSYDDYNVEQLRKQIFKDNKEQIDRHNKRYAAGKETYKMGVNQFTDLLPSEFKSLMLTSYNTSDMSASIEYTYSPLNLTIPKSKDWRTEGAVTRVKNQSLKYSCGCCYAFAAVSALEGHQFIKYRRLTPLSEQNVVDCSKGYNNGCKGGSRANALYWIKANGGIDTEQSYPYTSFQGKCLYNPNNIGARVTGVVAVAKSEQALAEVVAFKGPVAVGIYGNLLQHYHSGVFSDNRCYGPRNHAVTVVGYGPDYWLIKNSWGATFGEHGYLRLARNRNNLCYVASDGVYPLV